MTSPGRTALLLEPCWPGCSPPANCPPERALPLLPVRKPPAGRSGFNGGSGLGELIHGTTFDETQAQNLVSGKKIDPLMISAGAPTYLEAVAKAATNKGLYTAVVIIPSNFPRPSRACGSPPVSDRNNGNHLW